ncbi:MAG: hypothetical protein ACYCQI_05075 [Gammaproteobacteria bacterium]
MKKLVISILCLLSSTCFAVNSDSSVFAPRCGIADISSTAVFCGESEKSFRHIARCECAFYLDAKLCSMIPMARLYEMMKMRAGTKDLATACATLESKTGVDRATCFQHWTTYRTACESFPPLA